jgi:two-component system OmpR family response regulator
MADRILIVDDDPPVLRMLVRTLAAEGYETVPAPDGGAALAAAERSVPDLVVLDVAMPGLDGLQVCRRLREKGVGVPVLLLTARDTVEDRVAGLDAGADDYVAKPFRMEELLARVRALIRRAKGQASAELRCGPITLDTRTGRVTVDGRPVPLTGHEYRVLAYLMHRKGQLVSRSELAEHVYAQDLDRDSNTIEVFIGRLRRKLGVDLIATVRGLGYRLEAP